MTLASTAILVASASMFPVVALAGCVIRDPEGPTPPMVAKTFFRADQSVQTTVSSRVPTDATLIPGSVKLIQVNGRGELIASLGALHHDGMHGDAHVHDNQFSSRRPISLLRFHDAYFAVRASYSSPSRCRQSNYADVYVQVVDKLINNLNNTAYAFFDKELNAGTDRARARQDLVRFIRQQPGVADAVIAGDGYTVFITLTSGETFGISTSPPGTGG
ncbi:MAG TPA: hypothetical protein VMT58_02530 [Candidatus Binataceae bacterium]|nr:hypothetical protein [Candidatus Binataceae bacterium]